MTMEQLSPTQREILLAIIDLYEKEKKLVKSKEIADVIGKDEGTVRNVISSLKALGLLESKPGPNGGYVPTLKAYEFTKASTYLPQQVVLYRDDIETNIKVFSIELLDITNPQGTRVLLRVSGDMRSLRLGDLVKVGPLPNSRLMIEGRVTHMDVDRKELLLDVTRMVSIPKIKVGDMIRNKKVIVLKPEYTLKEAAKVLYSEGIRGAPVVDEAGKVIGILTTADIMKALFEERIDSKVADYMRRSVISISINDDIIDAINKMLVYNVGRLIVLDSNERLIGILTRTDILKTIAGLEKAIVK